MKLEKQLAAAVKELEEAKERVLRKVDEGLTETSPEKEGSRGSCGSCDAYEYHIRPKHVHKIKAPSSRIELDKVLKKSVLN